MNTCNHLHLLLQNSFGDSKLPSASRKLQAVTTALGFDFATSPSHLTSSTFQEGAHINIFHEASTFLKACSHDPLLRIRCLVPKTGNRRSDGPISRFRFCGENVGRSFVVCSYDLFFRTTKESSI